MKWQWKVTLAVGFAALAIVGLIHWRGSSAAMADAQARLAKQAESQLENGRQLANLKIESLKSELVRLASHYHAGLLTAGAGSGFDIVALLQPHDAQTWIANWTAKTRSLDPAAYPTGFEQTLLKSLPYANVKDGQTYFVRLTAMNGDPIYAVLCRVEMADPNETAKASLPETPVGKRTNQAMVVGLMSQPPLASVFEEAPPAHFSEYLLDERGYINAHTDKSYWGALFSEDSLVQEVLRERRPAGTGRFTDLDNVPILGVYRRIAGSNLIAAVTVQTHAFEAEALAHSQSVLRFGLILALLLSVATYMAMGQVSVPQVVVEKTPVASAPLPVAAAPLPLAAQVREDRFLYSKLSEMLKEPLAAILSHVQLAKKQKDLGQVRDHAKEIEAETRRLRLFADELRWLSGQTLVVKTTVCVSDVLQKILRDLRPTLRELEVELDTSIAPHLHSTGSEEAFAVLLRASLQNAVESVRWIASRKISVHLGAVGGELRLQVIDSGGALALHDAAFEVRERLQQRLSEELAGSVTFSVENGQSVVTLKVPQVASDAPAVAVTETLGGRLPLSTEEAAFLPKTPTEQETQGLQRESLEVAAKRGLAEQVASRIKELDKTEKEIHFQSAIGLRVNESWLGEDEDDEQVSWKPLTKMSTATVEAEPVREESTLEMTADGGFVVQIRKPKKRS